jgi:hypothetical protein
VDAPAVRPGVRAALRGRRAVARRVPLAAPLVLPVRLRAARPGGVLLDGVRHPRVAGDLLGWARGPGGRPLQGGERPRGPARGGGASVPLRLLPPDGGCRRLPAAHLPRLRLRPASGAPGAGPGWRDTDRSDRSPGAGRPRRGLEGPGRARPGPDAGHRHRAQRPRRPAHHGCALRAWPRDAPVPGDRAGDRGRASPACPGHSPRGVPPERGSRRLPQPRAGEGARADRGQPGGGARRHPAHRGLHHPHPGASRKRDLRPQARPQVPRALDPGRGLRARRGARARFRQRQLQHDRLLDPAVLAHQRGEPATRGGVLRDVAAPVPGGGGPAGRPRHERRPHRELGGARDATPRCGRPTGHRRSA